MTINKRTTKVTALNIIRRNGYDRIADKISFLWGNPECEEYILDLIMDTREGLRKGFDPLVMECILTLYNTHQTLTSG